MHSKNLVYVYVCVTAFVFLVLGLIFGVGYEVGHEKSFGVTSTTVGYQSAQNSQLLFNALQSLLNDVTNTRAPLASLSSATSSVSWGSIISGLASSSVINLPSGGKIGDLLLVAPAASGSIVWGAQITAAGATNATATIYAISATTTATIGGTQVMSVWDLSSSTFATPAALFTSTSTSSN